MFLRAAGKERLPCRFSYSRSGLPGLYQLDGCVVSTRGVLVLTVQSNKEKLQCGFLLHSALRLDMTQCELLGIFFPYYYPIYDKNATHESSCLIPMRPPVSRFSTWISFQASHCSSSRIVSGELGQAESQLKERTWSPACISVRFCPVHPLETA